MDHPETHAFPPLLHMLECVLLVMERTPELVLTLLYPLRRMVRVLRRVHVPPYPFLLHENRSGTCARTVLQVGIVRTVKLSQIVLEI